MLVAHGLGTVRQSMGVMICLLLTLTGTDADAVIQRGISCPVDRFQVRIQSLRSNKVAEPDRRRRIVLVNVRNYYSAPRAPHAHD